MESEYILVNLVGEFENVQVRIRTQNIQNKINFIYGLQYQNFNEKLILI